MQSKLITARDVMHQNHLELDGLATVREALNSMKESNTDIIIVNKRHEHDVIGIVLLSDITKKVLAKDRAIDRVNVYEIMSKPVITIEPGMDVRYCARLFDRFGISNAPVVEAGKILGVVSYNELIFEGLCLLID
jgi:signal-transduction protein with cAMP-binding, CBS, and nucleotidyltransferase domain